MAARENQGLFIAVILLVLLSVVLAVATFFGFTGAQEASDRANNLQEQLDKASADADAYQGQAGVLKSILGMQGFAIKEIEAHQQNVARGSTELVAETNAIMDTYEEDMNSVSSDEENIDRTYTKAIKDVLRALADSNNTQVQLNEKVDETDLKMRTELAAKDAQLREMQTQLDKSREDLTKEQGAHEETRSKYTTLLNDREQELTIAKNDLTKSRNALKTTTNNLQAVIQSKDKAIQERNNEIADLKKTETDRADGQIVKVAPRLDKVTINLGDGDRLRLRQSFAVYDRDTMRYKSGNEKATIEVTRILGPHLAEGRITSNISGDPILRHDWIVTSTWDPGNSIDVAIVGRVDLDGDGRSDMQRLISMVEQNGGNVVAYHDEEGKVYGQINESTRWFVKGKEPLKAREGFKKLDAQRSTFQVTEISVGEFLNEMGIAPEAERTTIERLDNDLPSREFVPRKATTVEQASPFGDQ